MATSTRKQVIFIFPTRLWTPQKTGRDCFLSLYPWWTAHCMRRNRQLINVCWMNNAGEEVEDNTPSLCLLSSYSALFLNVDKVDRGSCKELWVMGLTPGPPSCRVGPTPWNFLEVQIPHDTSSGTPHFQGWSFWPLAPVAYWPVTAIIRFILARQRKVMWEEDNGKHGTCSKERRVNNAFGNILWSTSFAGREWDEKSGDEDLPLNHNNKKERKSKAGLIGLDVSLRFICTEQLMVAKQEDLTDKKKAITGSTPHYFPLISSAEQ